MPVRLGVRLGVDVEVWVHVGVMADETLALFVDVIVLELVIVKVPVFVTDRDCVDVCVPD